MSGVPNVFGSATSSIPLSQLDVNFNTPVTIGNTTVGLGNTTTIVGNLTVQNVTLSSTNGDANIHGLTVGQGAGSVSTNTAVGASALGSGSQSGLYNSAFAYGALGSNTTGSGSTAGGLNALANNTMGGNNTAWGNSALVNNTTASNNTAVGYQAMYSTTTGSGSNTSIGYQAGYSIGTGSNNICIGRADVSSQNITNELTIATNTSVNYGKGSNTGFINPNGGGVYQGNNSATWSVTSDARLKKNIVDNTEGLSIISQIRVRNFEYRTAEEVTELPTKSAIDKQGVQLGVIAQELQEVCGDCVKTESTGVMSVNQDNLTWHMINAIKELKAEFDAYKATHP